MQSLEPLMRVMSETVGNGRRDLTMRQMAVLMHVHLRDGPHTVRGLAARFGLPKPSVTRALDALTRHGFARRVPDPNDRRNVFVEITEAGRGYLEILAAIISSVPGRA